MSQVVIGLVGAKGAGKNTFASIARRLYPQLAEAALADKLKNVCADVFGIERDNFDRPDRKERFFGNPLFFSCNSVNADNTFVELGWQSLASIVDLFGFSPTEEKLAPYVGKRLFTPRQVAQYIGTEVLRSFSPDVHCLGLLQDAPEDRPLIVTDLRFQNELDFFRKRFGDKFFPVYVSNRKAEEKAASDGHASEAWVREVTESFRTFNFLNDPFRPLGVSRPGSTLLAEQLSRVYNNGSVDDLEKQVASLVGAWLKEAK